MPNGRGPLGPGKFTPPGRGRGRGRQPDGFGLGPNGECVCGKCGKKTPHQRGIPCYEQKCPDCGVLMTREK